VFLTWFRHDMTQTSSPLLVRANKGSEDIVAGTMFKNTAGTLIGQTKTWITAINPMARPLSLQGD